LGERKMTKTGFNPKVVQELANSIADTFNAVGKHISENWPTIPTVLQENWKGNDEQNFESQIAYRVRDLYNKSTDLVTVAANNMIIGGLSWEETQNTNRLTGAEGSIETVTYNLEMPTINVEDLSSVKLRENSFAGEDLAITDSTAPAIKAVIEDYVNTIKTKVMSIYESLDSNIETAFYGQQTTKIKAYIEAIAKTLADFNTYLADFYSKVDPLITGTYEARDTEIGEKFEGGKTDIESSTSSLDIGI